MRVACVADGAGAGGCMQTGLADSIRAAWVYIACVSAGALDTLVRVPTVPVY